MTIEEYEDSAVRGLLGTAFADPEPPLRDLASGSIARGDALRRRNRLFAAGGAMLSVVAVIGTFAVVTRAAPAGHGHQAPAEQVTSAPSPTNLANPKGYLGFGPVIGSVGKMMDVKNQLPGLLQPLLPAGVTASRPSQGDNTGPHSLINADAVVLTKPTGTTNATMWVGLAPAAQDQVREVACPQAPKGSKGGTCTTLTAQGGTVYLDEYAATATDAVRLQSLPADVVKPGTGDTIVSRTLSMTFVPTDRTKYAFHFTEQTSTGTVLYADHEPSDYMTGGIWPPPAPVEGIVTFDASGPALSATDLLAMVAKPGLAKLEYLLDPRTEVSQDTQNKVSSTEAQIVAAAEAALPSGMKVTVDTSIQPRMILTGPTGKNALQWDTNPHIAQSKQQTLGWCPPNVACTKRAVPGGTLAIWVQKPTDSNLRVLSNTPSVYNYWFFPDDMSKPALSMTLETSANQTGQAVRMVAVPGQTYTVNDGPYAPAQVSADQFLAAVQSGQLATAISKTTSLLAMLS